MNDVCLLDTNILVRALTDDLPDQARRGRELVDQLEAGERRVMLSPLVLFELIFTLQNSYKTPREFIAGSIKHLLSLGTVDLAGKQLFLDALEEYRLSSVGFADIYNARYARARGSTCVYSWDRDFDRLPGITRREPGTSSG
jgi:predicted nucleic acid-binding protein